MPMHRNNAAPVILVAGLGRCGSSLTMQMLEAGGVPVSGQWPGFEDDRCGAAVVDMNWLRQQAGKAVKLLDPQRSRPRFVDLARIVIWLNRDIREQAESIAKFSEALFGMTMNRSARRRLKASLPPDTRSGRISCGVGEVPSLELSFEGLICAPLASAVRLRAFLLPFGFDFNVDAAARVVRPRDPHCYPGFLEIELMKERA